MQQTIRVGRLVVGADFDFEKTGAAAALADFAFRGFAHRFDFQVQAQRNAGQGVVAIQHHMFRVNLGDGVERIALHHHRDLP